MKKWAFLTGFFLFGIALLFRFQTVHVPFWVDEFSSAYQAHLLLQHGFGVFNNPNFYFEYQNLTTHALIALSFALFGASEFTARFPMMIIGSLVPVAVYYLGKKMYSASTGLVAAVLTVFSYFMITWSRQARGYVLQQLLVMILFWSYFVASEKGKYQRFAAAVLFLTGVIGVLTHTMFVLALGAIAVHFCIFHRQKIARFFRTPWLYAFILVVLAGAIVTGLAQEITSHLLALSRGRVFNNVWYYHSFLWREYALITFLSVVGFLMGFLQKRQATLLVVLYVILQLFFLSFLFGPYVSRYVLPFFPFLFLGVGYAFTSLWSLVSEKLTVKRPLSMVSTAVPLLLAMIIVVNGDKFSIKPKAFYSVNHDFREIAVVDYDQVYSTVRMKGRLEEGKTAVIDTWGDRLLWYMGSDFRDGYMFRWVNADGLMKQTAYAYNDQGERIFPNRNDVKFVGDLADLQKVMQKYPRGFIWIDDSSLPADVLEYVKANFTKELTLDHFELDDNPLSIWPGTLYSWGISP